MAAWEMLFSEEKTFSGLSVTAVVRGQAAIKELKSKLTTGGDTHHEGSG